MGHGLCVQREKSEFALKEECTRTNRRKTKRERETESARVEGRKEESERAKWRVERRRIDGAGAQSRVRSMSRVVTEEGDGFSPRVHVYMRREERLLQAPGSC